MTPSLSRSIILILALCALALCASSCVETSDQPEPAAEETDGDTDLTEATDTTDQPATESALTFQYNAASMCHSTESIITPDDGMVLALEGCLFTNEDASITMTLPAEAFWNVISAADVTVNGEAKSLSDNGTVQMDLVANQCNPLSISIAVGFEEGSAEAFSGTTIELVPTFSATATFSGSPWKFVTRLSRPMITATCEEGLGNANMTPLLPLDVRSTVGIQRLTFDVSGDLSCDSYLWSFLGSDGWEEIEGSELSTFEQDGSITTIVVSSLTTNLTPYEAVYAVLGMGCQHSGTVTVSLASDAEDTAPLPPPPCSKGVGGGRRIFPTGDACESEGRQWFEDYEAWGSDIAPNMLWSDASAAFNALPVIGEDDSVLDPGSYDYYNGAGVFQCSDPSRPTPSCTVPF